MENKILPTAEEYAHTQYLKRKEEVGPGQFYPEPPSTEQIKDMNEFARLQVIAELKQHIEHPSKPGYKRSDIVARIKELETIK